MLKNSYPEQGCVEHFLSNKQKDSFTNSEKRQTREFQQQIHYTVTPRSTQIKYDEGTSILLLNDGLCIKAIFWFKPQHTEMTFWNQQKKHPATWILGCVMLIYYVW